MRGISNIWGINMWGMISIALALVVLAALALLFTARKEQATDESFMTHYVNIMDRRMAWREASLGRFSIDC